MRYRVTVLCCAVLTSTSAAQAPQRQPHYAVHVGFGNHYGWLGAGVEVYPLHAPLSVFGGIGILPEALWGFPTTVAGAGGLRYYVPLRPSRHRLFADVSISLLQISQAAAIGAPVVHDYGLGVSIGYSYLAGSGLTVTAGGGAGRANYDTVPVLHVGVGWTKRR